MYPYHGSEAFIWYRQLWRQDVSMGKGVGRWENWNRSCLRYCLLSHKQVKPWINHLTYDMGSKCSVFLSLCVTLWACRALLFGCWWTPTRSWMEMQWGVIIDWLVESFGWGSRWVLTLSLYSQSYIKKFFFSFEDMEDIVYKEQLNLRNIIFAKMYYMLQCAWCSLWKLPTIVQNLIEHFFITYC